VWGLGLTLAMFMHVAAGHDLVRANYRYDPLERLLAANEGATTVANQTYSYDVTGNRLTFSAGADAIQAYLYPATSHRLGQVDRTLRGYDANGNTVQVGGTAREYVYNSANRLAATQQAGVTCATYRYNARREQVLRSGATHTVYVYDEAGRLLGQYGASGAPVQQYVWMEGLPVGVISANTLHYVEAASAAGELIIKSWVDSQAQLLWTVRRTSAPSLQMNLVQYQPSNSILRNYSDTAFLKDY